MKACIGNFSVRAQGGLLAHFVTIVDTTGAVVISSENVTDASAEVPVHLIVLQCTGHETDLLGCQHSFATENCTHDQDIGVQCLPGLGEMNVPLICDASHFFFNL